MRDKLKNKEYRRQKRVQRIVGIVEFIGIPVLLAFLTSYVSPFYTDELWEWVERTAFVFLGYETIIIISRKIIVDAKKDMLIAVKAAYELGEHYCEHKRGKDLEELIFLISRVNGSGMMNCPVTQKDYENLNVFIENKDKASIQKRKIYLAQALETCDLLWQYTLLLRLVK